MLKRFDAIDQDHGMSCFVMLVESKFRQNVISIKRKGWSLWASASSASAIQRGQWGLSKRYSLIYKSYQT